MGELDERRPQPPRTEVVLERLAVESVGFHHATLTQQLIDSLQNQFPLRREAENVLPNHFSRFDRLPNEVQNAGEL